MRNIRAGVRTGADGSMSTRPDNITTERARPRLVIFDDDSVLLERFTKEYTALGYAVEPVLVAVGSNDGLIVDGRIKHHRSDYDPVRENDPNDWEYQDRLQLPERTVIDELRVAQREGDSTGIAIYSAMRGFTYGVTSKTQVRALLQEIKPDFVLSDLQMRSFADYDDMTPQQRFEDDDTIMGTDIMALAKQEVPHAPRAIHSGAWTQEEGLRPHTLAVRKMLHDDAQIVADQEGYGVFAKDTWLTAATPALVQGYFKAEQAKGRGHEGFGRV